MDKLYELPAIMSHPCGADEATAARIDEVTGYALGAKRSNCSLLRQ